MSEPIPPNPSPEKPEIDLAFDFRSKPNDSPLNFELKFDTPPPLPPESASASPTAEPTIDLVTAPPSLPVTAPDAKVPDAEVPDAKVPDAKVPDAEAGVKLDSQYISATVIHPDPGHPVAGHPDGAIPTAKALPVLHAVDPPSDPQQPPVAKKVLPQWLELEPEDRSDAVPHELHQQAPGLAGWRIVAASVRGKLHAHKGQYREDSFAWGTVDGWTILTVSDGAGSAKFSRIGSRLACDTALAVLKSQLKDYTFAPVENDAQPSQGDLHRVRGLLDHAGQKALNAITTEAESRGAAVKDFHCTLLVVLHTLWHDKHVVAVLQVGDGAIGLASPEWPHAFKRLGIADHGEYSSETRFLTTPGMQLEFANRVLFSLPKELRAITLMTDGVSDDFFPEDQRLGEVFYGQPIHGITMKDGGPVLGLMHGIAKMPDAASGLRDWLRYERRGSSDDRTLIVMHRS